jgi:hypothetical protein
MRGHGGYMMHGTANGNRSFGRREGEPCIDLRWCMSTMNYAWDM